MPSPDFADAKSPSPALHAREGFFNLRPVLAIGNFDGVHIGHQQLISEAKQIASDLKTAWGVLTFWPHPAKVLRGASAPKLLMTRHQKLECLKSFGVKVLIEEPFTSSFAAMPAEDFAIKILANRLGVRAVVVGENFNFGYQAKGNVRLLKEWLEPLGARVSVVSAVKVESEICSSSVIRGYVQAGNVERASLLLGRPYAIEGRIVSGSGRGRTLNIPTANLASENELLPALGVYATQTRLEGTQDWLLGATNIGMRPTFDDSSGVHIETHLLDFDGDIYGRKVELRFLKRIRDEMRFTSVDELLGQIHKDLEFVLWSSRDLFPGSKP